jgi:hypothetical protein
MLFRFIEHASIYAFAERSRDGILFQNVLLTFSKKKTRLNEIAQNLDAGDYKVFVLLAIGCLRERDRHDSSYEHKDFACTLNLAALNRKTTPAPG